MTIPRVKGSSWVNGEQLTPAQMTLLDGYVASGLDKREDQIDTLSSTITVNSSGRTEFLSGSSLSIDTPENVTIESGNLAIGGQLIGKTIPLRFGLNIVPVTSDVMNLTADQSNKFHLIFTDSPVGVHQSLPEGAANFIVVNLPSTSNNYEMLVDNQMKNDNPINLLPFNIKLSFPTNDIYVPSGRKVLIYFDGSKSYEVANNYSKIISEQKIVFTNGYSNDAKTTIVSTTNTSYQTLIDALGQSTMSFDAVAGDVFDINFSSLLITDGSPLDASNAFRGSLIVFASLSSDDKSTTTNLLETEIGGYFIQFNQWFDTATTLWYAPGTGTVKFGVVYRATSGTIIVCQPTALKITQIRPYY